MAVEPSQLIVGLLAASDEPALSVATLSRAGEQFDFAPGSMRVALTRLRQKGTVVAVERGRYALSPEREALQREVSAWRTRDELVGPWSGDWVALSTAGLPRSDRRVLRGRRRSLKMLGFATAAEDLLVRPHNLRLPLDDIRLRIGQIAPTAPVFRVLDLPAENVALAVEEWNPIALDETYAQLTAELEAAALAVAELPVGKAAALVFDLGDQAIRALVADPLLPDPLVDVDARHRLFTTMRRFDELGRRLWKNLLTEVAL